MKTIDTSVQMRTQVQIWKSSQKQIALVPTMGNLHAGHLSLVEQAKSLADYVIVSIFVNALQFNQKKDFENYPRTLSQDLQKLEELQVDAAFTPNQQDLYPNGLELAPRIQIPKLADEFCGKYRPGHFEGVCTVVAKLFNATLPDIAVFGKKDFQQLLIIKRLTEELNFDIEIIPGEIVREDDGLAMSSRNSHLSPEERTLAPTIFATLSEVANSFRLECSQKIESEAKFNLDKQGLRVEYLNIRDADNLQEISQNTKNYVVLTAAWLGDTRLIDNIVFQ